MIMNESLSSILYLLGMAGLSLWMSGAVLAKEPRSPYRLDRFTDLGAPVHRNQVYNHVLGKDARGNVRYYQAYRGTPWFLLSINPETGEQKEYIAHGHNGNPWGMLWASNGKLYITTGGGGTDDVFVFNPQTEKLTFLGRATDTEQVVWMLCEAENGKIYGGTYPNAKLISIDLATDELADLGRISPDQPYIRTLSTAGPYVYCNVGPSLPATWAYDTRTGRKTQILPDVLRTRKILRYGTAEKRADGQVYIYRPGSKDMMFRVDGLKVTPVDQMPPGIPLSQQGRPERAPLTLPDGTVISVDNLSGPDKYFWRTRPGSEPERVSVQYTGTSTPLWAVQEGPDGLIYGTTRTPLTLFVFDPETHQSRALGNPMGTNGQVYGWAWHAGRLFMASYGGSRFTVWDPDRPWRFGDQPGDNPQLLGTTGIGRPASLIVAPDDQHLLAGGLPDYGVTGGVLTVIDPDAPAADRFQIIERLLGEQSIASMVTIPGTDLVCIGTTWRGGSASESAPAPPRLLLWNFKTGKIEYETWATQHPAGIVQMAQVDGLIYATTSEDDGHLIVFDPANRKIVHTSPLGFGPGALFGLRYRERDGMLYAISGESIVRIDPATYAIERLGTYPGLTYGMAFANDSLYFCAGDRLIQLAIPPRAGSEN